MHTTALDQLATTFRLLTTGPNPPTVEADVLGGHQQGTITISKLADHLLDRATPPASRDAAWVHLTHRVRTEGGQWVVFAAGIALPGLRRTAFRVRHIWPHTDPDDADAEVLSGFLSALTTIDLDEPHICSRLCQRAFHAGRKWARDHIYTARVAQKMYESRTPPRVYGHPDLILAQSVRDNVITRSDAQLIAATRLDAETLAKTAANVGLSVSEVRIQRKRAETSLAEWITGES